MNKPNFKVLVFAVTVAAVSANANAQSTLQEDIDQRRSSAYHQ